MSEVSAQQARVQWLRLLVRALRGESTTITHRGRPIAALVHKSTTADTSDVATSIQHLRERAKRLAVCGFSAGEIRDLINEGWR